MQSLSTVALQNSDDRFKPRTRSALANAIANISSCHTAMLRSELVAVAVPAVSPTTSLPSTARSLLATAVVNTHASWEALEIAS